MTTHLETPVAPFEMKVGMTPFTLRHDLSANPLFTLEAMADLAAALPQDKVDYNMADLPLDVSGTPVQANGLSRADTVRSIRENGSWMVLREIDHQPAYRQLLDEIVDQIAEMTGTAPSTFTHRTALGFVTSPGGITPFHLDSEHNFLLQITGHKRMTIVPGVAAMSPEDIEISPSKSRYIEFRPGFAPLAKTFDLGPGDALCVPFNDPHYVENGDEVSVSLGITFHDADTRRRRKIQTMNHMLRRVGLPQPVPGIRPKADGVKVAAYDTVNAVLDPIRRNEKARQFVKRHILRGAALTPDKADLQPT